MLEQGGHVFRARWVAAASRGFPRNLQTGRPYRGANVLLLWDEALTQGYATPLWMTYRQAKYARSADLAVLKAESLSRMEAAAEAL